MDKKVKADPGAGVGKAGVETPWDAGSRKGEKWSTANVGAKGWEDAPAKGANTPGRPHDRPYEKTNSNDGTDQNQAY